MDTLAFPNQWVNGQIFERVLGGHPATLTSPVMAVRFNFPSNCKIMVDAGLRLLSLANQLQAIGKDVTLAFDIQSQTFGYLNRMGFFDLLHPKIKVEPERPAISGAVLYRGVNQNLVEFAPINPVKQDGELPSRLEQALTNSVSTKVDRNALGHAAYTMFGELISNIYEHSETSLDGFAALQVYKNGGRATVAVSDSGKGLIETLRPALEAQSASIANLPNTSLLLEAFRNGLSRHGKGRGNGLKQCATKAIRYSADLEIRLPTCYVRLKPSSDGYTPHMAYTQDNVPLIWGTHISFNFALDR